MKPKVKINKPPTLFTATQRLIASVEKKIGATLIAYWDAPNGSVCQDDVQTFYALLRHLGPQNHANDLPHPLTKRPAPGGASRVRRLRCRCIIPASARRARLGHTPAGLIERKYIEG